jgi:hypothetical protein
MTISPSNTAYNQGDYPYCPLMSQEQILSLVRFEIATARERHGKAHMFETFSLYAQVNDFETLEWDLAEMKEIFALAAKEPSHAGAETNPVLKQVQVLCYAFVERYFIKDTGTVKPEYITGKSAAREGIPTYFRDIDGKRIYYSDLLVDKHGVEWEVVRLGRDVPYLQSPDQNDRPQLSRESIKKNKFIIKQ